MTDMIILRSPVLTGGQAALPFTGEWPPPEQLRLWVHRVGRQAVLSEPDPDCTCGEQACRDDWELLRLDPDWEKHDFTRISASSIPEPAPEDAHWFRGALYEPTPAEVPATATEENRNEQQVHD